MEYNLDRLDVAVFTQMGNAIEAAIRIYSLDGFLAKLENRQTKPNPKYAMLEEQERHRKKISELEAMKLRVDRYLDTEIFKEVRNE